jgi:hypothetical protein
MRASRIEIVESVVGAGGCAGGTSAVVEGAAFPFAALLLCAALCPHAAENRAAASAATDPTANCLRESFFIIPPQLQTTLYCPPPPLSRGLPGASAHRMLFKGELAEEHLLPANL